MSPALKRACHLPSCSRLAGSAMFCPQCKSEYRPGFTHCADCDVDWVESLPEPSGSDTALSDASLREVWTGDDEQACVDICSQLSDATIPFHVVQPSWQLFKGMEQAFRIRVPVDSYDQAKEIIDKAGFDLPVEAEDQGLA